VVAQHVEHATNNLVNVFASHLTQVVLAVTVLEESELLDTTDRLPEVLQNQPQLLALQNQLQSQNQHLPQTPNVQSALTVAKNVVVLLAVLATVNLVNVSVNLVILVVLAVTIMDVSVPLLTKPENLPEVMLVL